MLIEQNPKIVHSRTQTKISLQFHIYSVNRQIFYECISIFMRFFIRFQLDMDSVLFRFFIYFHTLLVIDDMTTIIDTLKL